MTPADATATRSKRATAAPDDSVTVVVSALPENRRAEARERLEAIRHRRDCPVDVYGMNAAYTDSDGAEKVARVEVFVARAIAKNASESGMRVMDTGADKKPTVVVARCLECGEQEPSD